MSYEFMPRSTRELFVESLRLYWKNAVSILIYFILPSGLFEWAANLLINDEFPALKYAVFAAQLLSIPVILSAGIVAAARIAIGRALDFSIYFWAGIRRLYALTLLMILIFAVMAVLGFGLTFLAAIPALIVGKIGVIVGLVITVIALIGVSTMFIFVPIVIVIEGTGVNSARDRNEIFLKGFEGRAFKLASILVLAQYLQGPLLSIFGLSQNFHDVVQSALSNVIIPFLALALVLFYIDTRVRKEGYTAEQLAAELDRRASPAPTPQQA